MPKNTFINLPSEKRKLIIDVTIDEFNDYGYQKASISRIVERAGIAKGSFYQYFDGKKDLFIYIIEIASEKKITYFKNLQNNKSQLNFFQLLNELYKGALQFLMDNPKLARIVDDLMKNADQQLKEEILGGSIQKSNEFMKELLMKGISENEINPNIDVNFTTFLLTSISISLGDYFRSFSSDLNEIDEKKYIKLVEETTSLLKNGIGQK